MAKLTLDDLRKLRDQQHQAMAKRDPSTKDAQIIVGMGTCGIAAGAKDTFNAIVDELDSKGISTVLVRQTGCMGLCHSEPTVEVIVPDMPIVIYGNVDAAVGREIVNDHIINKKLVDKHICDKPALDIVSKA
ncbi:MAG: (2Fe-2S) ferredoxin domain-containing protein [Verrucomicrobiota bacterium]|jgi:NADP-reducing hydrogenase subunit HndB|nr:(2Fe-2S) ferredoxin domain-containing protein [Verrucomicrobiota bacterium]